MSKVSYLVLSWLVYSISVLPFGVLYVVSDLFYLLGYKIIRYRKDLVQNNLRNAFPEKSETEINAITKRFYKSFFDILLEAFRISTLSQKEITKRMQFINKDIFNEYYKQGKNVIVALGHYGNWELSGAGFYQAKLHKLYAIYHPLENKHFNQIAIQTRKKAGINLLSMRTALKSMRNIKNELSAIAFIADQSPNPKHAIWLKFLNQTTPFFPGLSLAARHFNYPIVYIRVNRLRRGYYQIEPELLCDEPQQYSNKELTSLFVKHLEKDIQAKPELWLWSHNRWKHKPEDHLSIG